MNSILSPYCAERTVVSFFFKVAVKIVVSLLDIGIDIDIALSLFDMEVSLLASLLD